MYLFIFLRWWTAEMSCFHSDKPRLLPGAWTQVHKKYLQNKEHRNKTFLKVPRQKVIMSSKPHKLTLLV